MHRLEDWNSHHESGGHEGVRSPSDVERLTFRFSPISLLRVKSREGL